MNALFWLGNRTARVASKKRHIGKLLSRRRKTLGLTVIHVAQFCNVTRGRVYQWEQERSVLAKNLASLSKVLKIPLRTLVEENGQGRHLKKTPQCIKLNILTELLTSADAPGSIGSTP